MTDQFEFGPKMRLLNDRQRAFVMAYVEFPGMTGAEAARMAGYSDHKEGAKVRACNLLQDQRVIEAIQEQAGKKLWAISLKASHKMEQLIDSEDDAVALKAASAVLDRVGHSVTQNINVHQHVTDNTGAAVLEQIKRLADRLNLPVKQLLAKPSPASIEGEFSEVKHD